MGTREQVLSVANTAVWGGSLPPSQPGWAVSARDPH